VWRREPTPQFQGQCSIPFCGVMPAKAGIQ
jgi:hypothetical protein